MSECESVPVAAQASDSPSTFGPPDILSRPVVLMRPFGDAGLPRHWNRETTDPGERAQASPGSSARALARDLARFGFGPGDVLVLRASMVGRTWPYVVPRDLPWSSLPVVHAPGRDPDIGYIGWATETCSIWTNSITRERHEGFVASFPPPTTELVVIDAAPASDDVVWKALASFHESVLERGLAVAAFDGETLTTIDHERIRRVCATGLVRDRLNSSFHVNWSIMISRAFAIVAVEEGWSRHQTYARTPRPGTVMGNALSPFAAQVMFALDRHRLVEDPVDIREAYIRERCAALLAACPWARKEDDGFVLEWAGSGTYPPLVCRPVPGYASHHWTAHADVEDERVLAALDGLEKVGLIGIGADGALGITRLGRRILEAMGRGAEDVDLVLRWRNAGDEAIPAIDRWIHKAFRATKRKVSSIPSPEIAVDGLRSRSVGIVYGGLIPMGDRLRDPALAKAVASLLASQDGMPFLDRFVGLVETDALVQPEFPPYLWYGAPVGAIEEALWRSEWIGWTPGLAELDEIADVARAVAAPLSPDHGFEPHGLSCVGTVVDPTIKERVRLSGAKRGAPSTMVGVTVEIPAYDAPAQRPWVDEFLTTVHRCLSDGGIEDGIVGSLLEYGRPGWLWWGIPIEPRLSGDGDPIARVEAAAARARSALEIVDASIVGRLPDGVVARFGAWDDDPRRPPSSAIDRRHQEIIQRLTPDIRTMVSPRRLVDVVDSAIRGKLVIHVPRRTL